MKKQSANLTVEYDRLLEEHSKLLVTHTHTLKSPKQEFKKEAKARRNQGTEPPDGPDGPRLESLLKHAFTSIIHQGAIPEVAKEVSGPVEVNGRDGPPP